MAAQPEPSLRQLVGRTTDDLNDLVRAELALAKAEMREEVKDVVKGVVLLGMSLMPVFIGGIVLVFAAAWVLASHFGNAVGFAIVGGALVVVGGAFAFGGLAKFGKVRGLPLTRETLTHDVPERLS
jgi:uncharacterized membrane protein YqjE